MLVENVVFHARYVWMPYEGCKVVWGILATVSKVFKDFAYHRELIDVSNWALGFSAQVGEYSSKGIDLIGIDEHNLIAEFEVFIRSANGLQALGEMMSNRLTRLERKSLLHQLTFYPI